MTRRAQLFILAVLVVGALAGVAARAATQPHHGPAKVFSQCDLPVSRRTGGWLCPDPTGTAGPDR